MIAPDCSPRDSGFTAIRGVAPSAIEEGIAFEAWGRRIQRESGRAARLALNPAPPLRNLAIRVVPDRLRVKALERLLIA